MTLLECNEVQKQRFCTIMDQQPWKPQNTVFKFNIPEPIGFPFSELDSSLF
jgi:hypothetical protein